MTYKEWDRIETILFRQQEAVIKISECTVVLLKNAPVQTRLNFTPVNGAANRFLGILQAFLRTRGKVNSTGICQRDDHDPRDRPH